MDNCRVKISHNHFIDFYEFIKIINKGKRDGDKYCFLIGAGASVTSGIPAGSEMTEKWFDELKSDEFNNKKNSNDFKKDIDERIKRIVHLHPDKEAEEILHSLEKYSNILYEPNISFSQEDYNNIYELRFVYDEDEGKKYFLKISNEAYPNTGYVALASILCNGKDDIVITTNFDELIETSIMIYQHQKAFCIEHEDVAKYSLEGWNERPKVLKIHRGVAWGGFSKADDTKELHENWKNALNGILSEYIMIAVGFSGTDKDIMDYLMKCDLKTVYWCHLYSDIPNEKVQEFVKKKKGKLVSILDSDQFFYDLNQVLLRKRLKVYEKILFSNGSIYDTTRETFKNQVNKGFEKKVIKTIYKQNIKRINQIRIRNLLANQPNISLRYCLLLSFSHLFSIAPLFKWVLERQSSIIRDKYFRGYYELGKIYFKRKKYDEALSQFDVVIEKAKDNKLIELALVNEEIIYRKKWNFKKSNELLERILEIEPFNRDIEKQLKRYYYMRLAGSILLLERSKNTNVVAKDDYKSE